MEDNLLNNNYAKVLDIIGKEQKNKKQVEKDREEVKKLLFDMDRSVDNIDDYFNNGFGIVWNNLPEEIFDVSDIDKLNLRLYQFIKYVYGMESEFKDHGFSLIVAYYLKATDKFLGN